MFEPVAIWEWLACLAVFIVLTIGFTVVRLKAMKEDDAHDND